MKRNIYIVVFFLVLTNGFCQKKINIPETETGNFKYVNKQKKILKLDDLIQSKNDLDIRIWMGRQVVELNKNKNSISGTLTLFIYPAIKFSDKLIYKKSKLDSLTSNKLMDSLKVNHIFSLQGDSPTELIFHGDGIIFEISTPDQYRIFTYHPWGGSEVENLIYQIQDLLEIDSLDERFIHNLPPGKYFTGLEPAIHIDKFCDHKTTTSSLYRKIKELLADKFYYDENQPVTEFPLLILENHPVKMCDLNQYEADQIDKIKIFQDNEATGIFGDLAEYGVVYMILKK